MGNLEHALSAYENALRHNPVSLSGLTQVAGIARIKENYPKVRPRSHPGVCTRVSSPRSSARFSEISSEIGSPIMAQPLRVIASVMQICD